MDQTITIGTVIHGTLQDRDLLNAFTHELERVSSGAHAELVASARQIIDYMERVTPDTLMDYDYESLPDTPYAEYVKTTISSLINEELTDALQEYAPSHMYFGAIDGDGSDFGWWGVTEYDCETVTLDDENVIDVECQVHIHTNERGNVTVSELRGAVIWSAV
jgi:hypothetical protein